MNVVYHEFIPMLDVLPEMGVIVVTEQHGDNSRTSA